MSKRLHSLKLIILLLAFLEGGWLVVDGGRALLVGDYFTPQSGRSAGQLGPWSRVVAAAGLQPRSTLVKSVHLALGLLWLAAMTAFAANLRGGWPGMFFCAAAALWYLPFGTLLSILQMVLLLQPSVRLPRRGA